MANAATSDLAPRPNDPTVQTTKPPTRQPYGTIGFGNRREAVASVCNYVNQILEYKNGNTSQDIALPGQSNQDGRMPLTFLKPAVVALNALNVGGVTPMNVPTDSLDFHGFTSFVNRIITQANAVITALP